MDVFNTYKEIVLLIDGLGVAFQGYIISALLGFRIVGGIRRAIDHSFENVWRFNFHGQDRFDILPVENIYSQLKFPPAVFVEGIVVKCV